MRTTLDIDDDVLAAAKERARLEKKSAGEVLSELARQALVGVPSARQDMTHTRNGFTLLPRHGRLVTNELVREIQDDIDREELERAISLRRERPNRTP